MPPEEITRMKQWTYSFSTTDKKRPAYTKYESQGALTYKEALIKAGPNKYIGFYPHRDDPYILIDLDHVKDVNLPYGDIPLGMSNFFQKFPTYTEVTPSGEGLRFIYKFPSNKDKEELDGSYFMNSEKFERDEQEAQMNIAHPWQTITSNPSAISVNRVTEITLNDVSKVFSIRYKNTEVEPTPPTNKNVQLDSLSDVISALYSLPLTSSPDPRLKRAYKNTFNTNYSHYEYWVKVLMAVHNYGELAGKNIECYEAIVQWSQQDTESYAGEEDVHKHWRSLRDKETQISYKTLFKLVNTNRLKWPIPKKQTKEEQKNNASLKPLITEYVNFKALINFYNIQLYREESSPNIVYVVADSDIIKKFFMMFQVDLHYDKFYGPFTTKTLIPAFHMMCQDHGFIGIGQNQIKQFIANAMAESKKMFSFIKYYFDTPIDKLPQKYQENIENWGTSNTDFMFDCLRIDYQTDNHRMEEALYREYYKKWLMGIPRNLWFNDGKHMNNCILILTGPEQIRKTSHFKYLLPSFLNHLAVLTTHGFKDSGELRDIMKIASSSLLVFWDEIEEHLNSRTEANFKKLIDNNAQTIIDKYEVIERVIVPISIYGGSSNIREFKLGNEGSRRIFHIPVKWVDTDKLSTVCWHRLVNDLRKEIQNTKGEPAWLLSEQQLVYQATLHTNITAKNSIELILEEIFDFDTPFEDEITGSNWAAITSFQREALRLMTTRDVSNTLIDYGVSMNDIKRPNLIKTLERACGAYTGTQRKKLVLSFPACEIHKGLALQNQYKKWVMPKKRTVDNVFSKLL